MSSQDAFWGMVEDFVEQANDKAENMDAGEVGEALMHAASRYHAFIIAAQALDGDAITEDKDDVVAQHVRLYKRLLAEHLEDYAENYKSYFGQPEDVEGDNWLSREC